MPDATPTSQPKTTPINTTSGDMVPKPGHIISLSGGNADRIIIDHRRPSEDTRHREVLSVTINSTRSYYIICVTINSNIHIT